MALVQYSAFWLAFRFVLLGEWSSFVFRYAHRAIHPSDRPPERANYDNVVVGAAAAAAEQMTSRERHRVPGERPRARAVAGPAQHAAATGARSRRK